MSPKEEIARAGLWSRLGVLLIKSIARAHPPLDVHPGRQCVLRHPALQVSATNPSPLWHVAFFGESIGRHLRGRTTGKLFLKRECRQALAGVGTGDGCKIGMGDGYKIGTGDAMMKHGTGLQASQV
jgi:hypothetical protein